MGMVLFFAEKCGLAQQTGDGEGKGDFRRPFAIDTGRNHARKIVPVSRLPVGHIVEVQGNGIE